MFFFFKQKTAYEMRISDWSSDVCSSDLIGHAQYREVQNRVGPTSARSIRRRSTLVFAATAQGFSWWLAHAASANPQATDGCAMSAPIDRLTPMRWTRRNRLRSEEHTSELQSLMRSSYAVFFLKKKKQHTTA